MPSGLGIHCNKIQEAYLDEKINFNDFGSCGLASSVLLINATAADPKGTIVGNSVSGGPGETVEIPVTVDTASTAGVVALGISIEYDKDNLELVSWTNGDFFPALR